MNDPHNYVEAQRDTFEEELCQVLRIPSVSTDGQYTDSVRHAGEWVAGQFRNMGFETEIVETAGHPIVFSQSPPVPGKPVVLVYGHYDVQPPEPLDEWVSPPFDPTRRDGNIYARGATDDKGQMLTHIKGAQAWMATQGALPIQIKYVIEGEEEIGSQGLHRFIDDHADRLACDVAVISDTCQFARGVPAITYGLRGIAYYQLHLRGPKQDLHSGTFGGAVTNPAVALSRILAALIDDQGRVRVPGFYDDVRELTAKEREQFAALPFDEPSFLDQLGVTGLSGEHGFTTLERRWARPTFDINGLTSGYQGEGAKTIVPAWARAKFSFRLVPDQDPAKITEGLEQILQEHCPPGIEMTLEDLHGAPGVVMSLDSPYMSAASRAIQHGFGRAPVFIREGGSIPIVNALQDQLGVDTLLLGWGLDDDNTHGPNEKFSLDDFHRGIKASVQLWEELSQVPQA